MISDNNTKFLTVDSVIDIISLAKEFFVHLSDYELEDIPIPTELEKIKIKGILDQLQHSFDGVEVYPSLEEKCAILFYSFCKNHPLINGNKRAAVLVSIVFLYWNIDPDNFLSSYDQHVFTTDLLFNLAVFTVKSNPSEHVSVKTKITLIFSSLTTER